jgi:hypothetical protein
VKLEKALEAADAARKGIEEGEAALALTRLPETAVAELETLDGEIANLKAVAEAGRPTVAIAYESHAPTVRLDGKPLGGGSPQSYGGRAELSIPGVGVVTLRSNAVAVDDDRLVQFEERRHVVLISMGVTDLAGARRRQMEAQNKQSEMRELQARLTVLAPDGLASLREEVARRRETAAGLIELQATARCSRRSASSSPALVSKRRST